jgi:sRNA-binding carbon storage regulator CsrA
MPLTITRRKYQSVRIGEAVVTVRKTGARVVLTIDAPRDVPIVRDDARETEPRERETKGSVRND